LNIRLFNNAVSLSEVIYHQMRQEDYHESVTSSVQCFMMMHQLYAMWNEKWRHAKECRTVKGDVPNVGYFVWRCCRKQQQCEPCLLAEIQSKVLLNKAGLLNTSQRYFIR